MSKQRIYEYAKSLNIKSKDVIDELKKSGVEVSNHMQTLEDDQIKTLDQAFKKSNTSSEQKDTKKNNNAST
ncbi:translation initiation factor IF-2 N-terminal domain-containing protein, partial [Staphylococcus chromogenes]